MADQIEIVKKKIVEAEKKLEKLIQDNRKTELTLFMFDVMAGKSSLENLEKEDLVAFEQIVNGKMSEVQKRIELLSGNNPNEVVQAASDAEAMAKEVGDN